MKTYCRGMSNVITPTKITPTEPATTPSKSPASSKERKENENKATENKIPGLPDKDFKKWKKKKNQGKQLSEEKKHEHLKKSDFIKAGSVKHQVTEFIFSDPEDSDSDTGSSEKGFFGRSPLNSVNLMHAENQLLTTSFKPRSYKTMQNGKIWNSSVQQSSKRQLSSPEEDQHRKIRIISSSN